MPRAIEVMREIESLAPLSLQEDYDNSGLLTGDSQTDLTGVLLATDLTMEVLDEAIAAGFNMVITHHPVIFKALLRITGETLTERIIIKAIQNNILLYAAHTNLDMIPGGVSATMAQRIGLINTQILQPRTGDFLKLVVFVPESHADQVADALFKAGAGHIGHYDSCSFRTAGEGTFRGDETSNPFSGVPDRFHREPELRIETILPVWIKDKVIRSMLAVHPYEEVAWDLYPLIKDNESAGLGLYGELSEATTETDFLNFVKSVFSIRTIRHSKLTGRPIKRIALCGGSGGSLLRDAMRVKADVFITADLKYHQFFDPEGRLLLIDAGHFETEQFAVILLHELLSGKFPKFAVQLTATNTNPVNYF